MAVTLQCPRCMHEQKIDDDKADKDVPCKICHHLIKSASGKEKPKAKLKPGESSGKKSNPQGVHAGAPSPKSKAAADEDDEEKEGTRKSKKSSAWDDDEDDDDDAPRSKKKSKSRDEDDDEPAPRSRRSGEDSGSSGMMYMGLAAVGVLLLVLMCGGGGVGAYFMFSSSDRPRDEQVAQADNQPQDMNQGDPNPPPFNPNPPPFNPNPPPFNPNPPPFNPNPNPIPNPNPFPKPNPIPEVLVPGNPNDIDRVVALLNGPEQQRGPAFDWLARADPANPRRGMVMPILDGMVVAYVNNPPTFGNDGLFTAFNRWAGKENVPTLVHIVSKIRSTVWDNVYRHNAMRALGRLKDPRGAEVLAKKLDDFFDRGVASEALAELGAGAEKAVVPFLNHPGPFGTREAARKLLKGYNTRDDLLLTQCLIDLDSTEGERKTHAVQWIALTNVDAKRRPEIARGLNKAIQNEGSLRNQDLRTAIEKWATTDTVGKLIQILDQEKLGGHETIRLLGKLGDANGVKAIARQVGNFFNGNEAKAALKNAGPRAEPAVVEVMTTTQDGRVRTECARFLGEIGTRGSIQALTFTAQRFAQDVQLRNAAQQSIAAINGRGK